MLNVAMVGMGGISHVHRDSWKQIPEAKIVAVCDVREANVKEASEYTGGKAYLNFDEMLEKEQIDILDITCPTYLHPEFSIKAMEKGIHVLSEKPISLKREDVMREYAVAKKNNVRFMVAQCVRFWREYVYVRECYENGVYGKLLSGFMRRMGNMPTDSWDNWMRDINRSGLVPFDLHIHDLDFVVSTFGKPDGVSCHRARCEAQDYINAVYLFKDFFIATEAGWFDCNYAFQYSFRFQFEKAVLELKDNVFTVFHQDGVAEVINDTQETDKAGMKLVGNNGYLNEIRYFTDCVLAGKDCDKVKPDQLEAVLDFIGELNKA